MLDEGLNPSLSVPGCQVNLDGQSSSQWYPKPLEQPTRFYAPDTLDCRDALAPDAQGDITISCEEDVLRPQWVEQPLSAVQMPNDFQAPRMEDDSMDEDRLDGQKKNGKSWYEPEKDREFSHFHICHRSSSFTSISHLSLLTCNHDRYHRDIAIRQ